MPNNDAVQLQNGAEDIETDAPADDKRIIIDFTVGPPGVGPATSIDSGDDPPVAEPAVPT